MKIPPVFETTLAKDFPAGSFPGQDFHPKGSKVTAGTKIATTKLGKIVFTTPDPVFFFLKIACHSLEKLPTLLDDVKASGKRSLLNGEVLVNIDSDVIYEFFENAIQCVINLFTAVEALVNQHIPNLGGYEIRVEKKIKKFQTRIEVERFVPINAKLTFVCEYKCLNNPRKQTFWAAYEQLKSMRDEIIHLKAKDKAYFQRYEDIYRDLLDADYQYIFSQTKALLTYIDPEVSAHL